MRLWRLSKDVTIGGIDEVVRLSINIYTVIKCYKYGGVYILKTFLLDTNVILNDPACLKVFDDNEIVIPISVLDELDNAKVRADEVGRNARSFIRMLDSLRSNGSLSNGVKLGNSTIRVELNCSTSILSGLLLEKVDNKIINTALELKKSRHVIIVSKDINLRVKCDALGIEAQDYIKDKIAKNVSSVYSGTEILNVNSEVIDELFNNKEVQIDNINAYSNQFFMLKSNSKENHVAIARYIGNNTFKIINQAKDLFSIIPRNAEQKMAVDLLLDPKIKLVTLIGKAGSGKTLLASAAAMHHVISERKSYDRALISRPVQPMGKDIGYLPGSIEEKLHPWMQPIYDNLEFLLGGDYQSNGGMYEGLIQVEPLTYIRGRSLPKSFILLDESQNLSVNEIKTVITRVGEGTKIVITGDIDQIDAHYLDFANNGLTHVVEKFKEYSIAGHITLKKGERSELATLASQIL
jgi:PhoH-like ATPase